MNTRKVNRPWINLIASILSLSVVACGGGNSPQSSVTSQLGQAISGISSGDQAAFLDGQTSFQKVEGIADGLGPVFNNRSCVSCHSQGGVGGSAPNITSARVTRIGGMVSGVYSDLTNVGGPVIQSHSLQDLDPSYPIPPEVIPAEATFVSHRITTPLFGAGLIEAIPDSTIQARENESLPFGIKGHANMVTNILTGKVEVGRFGWKAQLSNLEVFAADAYINELGVTTTIFPNENLPQGKPIPAGLDTVADPEDTDGDVAKFAAFMRMLAPPSINVANQRGLSLFTQVGCAHCHVPSIMTGSNANSYLANQKVNLYSDLLLHAMGTDLADGIEQGQALGDEFRTAPLWGLSLRKFLLHDGRAQTVDEAIAFHGGEASEVRNRFKALSPQDRNDLLEFLSGL